MSDSQGGFIWYELMAADADAARHFYDAVLGWRIDAQSSGAIPYRMIAAGDGDQVGGVLTLSAEMIAGGARPGWYGYVCVDDVDAELAALSQAGGTTCVDQHVEGVGRIALVVDPQGVPLYLMDPIPPAQDAGAVSTAFDPAREGHVAWNELTTPDPAAAKEYYCARFGWELAGSMPMPGLGEYEFLALGGAMIGALMPLPEGKTAGWTFYWRTGDIDAAKARVEAAGGTPLHAIQQVPGGDFVLTCSDPAGATFGLVGSRP